MFWGSCRFLGLMKCWLVLKFVSVLVSEWIVWLYFRLFMMLMVRLLRLVFFWMV